MSPANNYKKLENRLIERLVKFFHFIGSTLVSFFRFIMQKGKQRFTVMFIPHSEKKIVNFHISIFSLVFLGMILVVLVFAFFGYSTFFTGWDKQYDNVSRDLEISQANQAKLENEIEHLIRSSEGVQNNLKELFKVFGEEGDDAFAYTGLGGDLILMSETINPELDSPYLNDLRELKNYMDGIQEPVMAIKRIIERQKELLFFTPNLWPLSSNQGTKVGRLTAFFGPEVNPFNHTFRLHNGVDIAWTRNTKIVATANGTIENIGYAPTGLGHNVTIRHEKYGFKTRYGHMDKILVTRGQYVERGDVIGLMGSTGLSTGPHLHYEIWVGEQVVDPMQYLDINNELIR